MPLQKGILAGFRRLIEDVDGDVERDFSLKPLLGPSHTVSRGPACQNLQLRESAVATYNQNTVVRCEELDADRLPDLDDERLSIGNCLAGMI